MNEEQYREFEKMPDWQLFGFLGERDSSERKQAALHILEMRRQAKSLETSRVAARASVWSAVAAIFSAATAIVMAYFAFVALKS